MVEADRELKAETEINAPAGKIWAALTDFKQLPSRSPELVAMIALKPGGLRIGQTYLGINRRKFIIWPTINEITTLDIGRTIAWDTKSAGVRWIYELTPHGNTTLVQERREIPNKTTHASGLFSKYFLGGTQSHDQELQQGIVDTLAALKNSIENK